MAAIINTNIASLNLQKSLSTSQAQLNKAMERLSSGLRINSAKDDAAGLAIATTLDSNIRGMQVAARNLNDAISFSQVQESALGSQTELLQRMRELAVQAKNGSLSNADRGNLNTEFQSLFSEVSRQSSSKFNGVNLFSNSAVTYQIGAATSDTVDSTAINALTGIASDEPADGTTALPTAAVGFRAVTVVDGTTKLNTTTFVAVNASGKFLAVADGHAELTDAEVQANTASGFNVKVKMSGGAAAAALSVADLNTAANAESMMTQVDAGLTAINTSRSGLGALQSRLNSISNSLASSIENSTAAKSRIMDADYAQETSNLTRGQILQQAGTAMLTQANSMPNIVLSLLKG